MQDISEDVRESDDDSTSGAPDASPLAPSPPREIIQGLRISTAPTVPAPAGGTPLGLTPALLDQHQLEHESDTPVLSRTSASGFASRRSSTSGHYASSACSGDVPYDPVGEREPGNPLFPTSFARLALGPTLRAKCVPYSPADPHY